MASIIATKYQDICAGHRVVGHEGKCRHLHGHNYRIHFFCKETVQPTFFDEGDEVITIGKKRRVLAPPAQTGLDDLGRVIDFTVIGQQLCNWVENNWDHKFLHWSEDTMIQDMQRAAKARMDNSHFEDPAYFDSKTQLESYVELPFNPTAENLAAYLVDVVGPIQLKGLGVTLVRVVIEETRKCSVEYAI